MRTDRHLLTSTVEARTEFNKMRIVTLFVTNDTYLYSLIATEVSEQVRLVSTQLCFRYGDESVTSRVGRVVKSSSDGRTDDGIRNPCG
jgi:hypothetical protein